MNSLAGCVDTQSQAGTQEGAKGRAEVGSLHPLEKCDQAGTQEGGQGGLAVGNEPVP